MRTEGASSVVRLARARDARDLRDLTQSVASEGRWIRSQVVRPIAEFRRRARRPWSREGAYLVAVVDDRVVGSVRISRESHPSTRHVASFGLIVAESHRGQGIGRALLAETIRWAEEMQVRKLELAVYPDNEAAIALYRSCGFVEEGRLRGHSMRQDGLQDEILMGRWMEEAT